MKQVFSYDAKANLCLCLKVYGTNRYSNEYSYFYSSHEPKAQGELL